MAVKKTTEKTSMKKNLLTRGKDDCCATEKSCSSKGGCGGAGSGALYFMGFLGAAIYYINTATSFWMGLWGIVKAFVWPALLVYTAMQRLGL